MIGLGNPGSTYEHTRHNVGFRTVDSLIKTLDITTRKRLFRPYIYGTYRGCDDIENYIVKSLTFMNNSGCILESLFSLSHQRPSDIILLCDNMDLPPGEIRIKRKGSNAGHNGIRSIMEYAGTGEFTRIYIGVGHPTAGISVIDHVLGIPSENEMNRIETAIGLAADCVVRMLQGESLTRVMNEYTRGIDL